ncbi:Protein of unknown function [Syntrophus gentianae]|uniref:DUF3124 domain-containing protein n=1 Tax=Syntrophus gentianae TaxID=43775 RepID=A0A1H7XV37_9BACT|nr:DUF3124 domain-containing protein [Syntrophus gentianae]SEM37503.1 Protein of unknown function [Syntrophus gentianae]
MRMMVRVLLIILGLVFFISCSGSEAPREEKKTDRSFSPAGLSVKESDGLKKVRGQVWYVPIYSNIPCDGDRLSDLSAFIAIHNTDLSYPIQVTKVLYFDNDGKLVKDFAVQQLKLAPLAATNFHIPRKDQSGTGANFLIEWTSDSPVSEPLIESIMVDCQTHKGLSFSSKGKVIREVK